MTVLRENFEERLQEVYAHLGLLEDLEAALIQGPLTIGASARAVSPLQQRILYSGVYLQLYNLVEATVSWCAREVCRAADQNWKPADLSPSLRKQWVRSKYRPDGEANEETRMAAALRLCELLIAGTPVKMEIDTGAGGNWDDEKIFAFCKLLGVPARISATTSAAVKQDFRDGKGALKLIVYLRNKLAHGTLSFSECAGDAPVSQLRDLAERTETYLREVISSFETFIAGHHFLAPDRRPRNGISGSGADSDADLPA
jgi:hypothetical protein